MSSPAERPEIQLNIDATAMVQAGLGSGYIEEILTAEIQKFVNRNEGTYLSRSQNISKTPVTFSVRVMYNPNINTAWFTSVMGIVNNVTMLAIILAGAAVVREREHGTMDHLLVMPVTPFEIAMSKIWANGLVITLAVALALEIIVKALLEFQSLARYRFSLWAPRRIFSFDLRRHFPGDHRADDATARASLHSRCFSDEHPFGQ